MITEKKIAFALLVVTVLAVNLFAPATVRSLPEPLSAAIGSLGVAPLAVTRAHAANGHATRSGWITTAYRDPYYDMMRILAGAAAGLFLARAFSEAAIERAYEAARELARSIRERGRDR
ncbi:MAG: hypothetical protein A2W26_10630 [Acidobacteria bacterium RBG_16_64_8]|nr:MAG: hypothetical protein A2W26_10630 [Acidobacteria bacterium RBG_16_64_8]